MVQKDRIQHLNDRETRDGRYVLYWMQQAQRGCCNHALEYAIRRGNEMDVPVLAAFGINQQFPGANERHYKFMLEGLQETQQQMAQRGILLTVHLEPPLQLIPRLARRASLVVADRGYLHVQRSWRRRIAESVTCRMTQVEGEEVVPVETASNKEEYAARTLRPRLQEHLDTFLVPLEETEPDNGSMEFDLGGVSMHVLETLLDEMRISRDAKGVRSFQGGTAEARRLLERFILNDLADYPDKSRDPNAGCTSHMSPYLHFGQISPIEIALKVKNAENCGEEAQEAYLEQLIVRRELSMNFCFYNPEYHSLECVPEWAMETLTEHADDSREYVYTRAELEKADTHDRYWNAAQQRMMLTGKMENYMRMYWGKKILEWSSSPRAAFRTALELNNRYELDGRDPNGYAGVAWCFGKHDQGWAERDVYGKVRYMSASGLERKFDMDRYIEETRDLLENAGRA